VEVEAAAADDEVPELVEVPELEALELLEETVPKR